jgi:hypothetical protein
VNNPDGLQLIEAARRGESATLTADVTEGWFRSPIPVVTIPGAEESDPFVLLHGHYDSWDFGIGDNAVGDATLLEVARVLWKHRDQLKRSVRIAWWPGHSTGRYAGSTWFADRFAIDLYENCIAQINCDSPGCRWATEYRHISWMDETEPFAQDVIREVTGQESWGERPHQAGDYSFNNIGISSFFMLLSTMPDEERERLGYYGVGGCGANIEWHTEEDLIHIADTSSSGHGSTSPAVMGATIAPFNFAHPGVRERWPGRAAGFSYGTRARRRSMSPRALVPLRRRQRGSHLTRRRRANAPCGGWRALMPVNYTAAPSSSARQTTPALPDLAAALNAANPARGFRTHLVRRQTVAALRDLAAHGQAAACVAQVAVSASRCCGGQ